MSLKTVLGELSSRLESIGGLRVYEYQPDGVNELPAVLIATIGADFSQSFSETDTLWNLEVTLLLRQWDTPEAMAALADYLEPTGSWSIRAAVDGGLSDSNGYLRVVSAKDVGRRKAFGGLYAAANFIVEARESTA